MHLVLWSILHLISCTIFASEIDCGALDGPVNGDVSVSSTTYNSTATYSCNTGYTLTGDDMRTCMESGLWSGSEPICVGKIYCEALAALILIHVCIHLCFI